MQAKLGGALVAGLVVGVAAGVMIGKRSADGGKIGYQAPSSPASPATPGEPAKPAASVLSGLAQCYLGDSEAKPAPLFALKDKQVSFQELPPADRTRFVRSLEEGWVRQNQIIESVALRMSAAKETGGELPELEAIAGDAATVENDEVKAFYEANKSGFPKESNLEKLRPTIEGHLKAQKVQRWVEERRAAMKTEGSFVSLAPLPCPPRVEMKTTDFAALGGKGEAPVEALVVTQPFCQNCRVSWPQLELLRKGAGGKLGVRPIPFVGKGDVPVDELFARAQFCAAKGGGDRLTAWLDVAHRAPLHLAGNVAGLTEWITTQGAQEAQLISAEFTPCVDSDDAKAFAAQARAMTATLGIDRPPGAYVNGRRLLTPMGRDDEIRTALAGLAEAAPAL